MSRLRCYHRLRPLVIPDICGHQTFRCSVCQHHGCHDRHCDNNLKKRWEFMLAAGNSYYQCNKCDRIVHLSTNDQGYLNAHGKKLKKAQLCGECIDT